jgi:tetratricopeptide (TPR) repeat protein
VFAANLPSLQNGFVWDDAQNIINNWQLRSWAGLWRIWTDPHATQQYYPLVQTSWWIETQLWGAVPLHFHVLNIALHALAALCLWACLRALALPGSWLAAALFALHPVQVESVAWITERKNVLCGVFFFASAYCLLRVLFPAPEAAPRAQRRLYVAGLFLFVCAMFSKTVACTLGVSLLVLVWWKRGAITRREALPIAPLIPFGAALGLLTAHLERESAGAQGASWAFSFAERCLIAGRALSFYLQSLLWPGDRVFIPPRWTIDAGDARQYAYPLAVVLVMLALWFLRKSIGRGPLAAALVYGVTLFPALGFFNVYAFRFSFAYDHFQYLAVPVPIALVSAAVVSRASKLAAHAQSLAIVAAALLIGACSALTWRQTCNYLNPETLWHHTLRYNPDCWLAHRNLANTALARGHTDEAIIELRAALRLDPSDAEGHNNLGVAYGWKGEREQSIAEFKRAIASDPKFLPTYKNLAVALALAGHEDEARKVLAFQQKIAQPAR